MAAHHADTHFPRPDDPTLAYEHHATPWEASERLWACVAALSLMALVGIFLLSGVRDSTTPIQNAGMAPAPQQRSLQPLQAPAMPSAETTGSSSTN